MERPLDALIRFFEESIPFNRHVGMKVDHLGLDRVLIRVPFADHLVGDPFRPALHGGVISTLCDTAGGLAVFARVGTIDARVSTVDLRVDYYAPGAKADLFAEATVVRLGNRVGVARILVHQGGAPIAEGKGVYNVRVIALPGVTVPAESGDPDGGG
jgi:uncharacterized protein (TIGR00369 family)